MFKIGVIGAGPAGMLASAMLAEKGNEVVLFEKNEKLGKKLYITGKGRCNVTNIATGESFLNKVVNGKMFLRASLSSFTSNDTINFLTKFGVKTKIERGGRVFPESDKSSDIIKAFEKYLKQTDVIVKLNTEVKELIVKDNIIKGLLTSSNERFLFDKIIVATGGISYPATGSTGDGYKFAKSFGHSITALNPALVPIIIKEKICSLEGISLKNVQLIAKNDKKTIFESEIGEMLFTENSLTGPLVLSCSSYINKYDLKEIKLSIDFKPALTIQQVEKRIEREFLENKNSNLSTVISMLLPKRLVDYFLIELDISSDIKINQITKCDRKKIVAGLKGLEFSPLYLENIERAVVTSGGVCLKEINPSTLESKIIKGLYFTGEVLDVDALTGGFNIQIALSLSALLANKINLLNDKGEN
ncbi:MAG: NAD(P)/FAD-dependent oxidoreductase [Clostridia bacterium]